MHLGVSGIQSGFADFKTGQNFGMMARDLDAFRGRVVDRRKCIEESG